MKKVKYLSLIMVMILMILGLTGCGDNTESENKKEDVINLPTIEGKKGLLGIVYYNPNTGEECTEDDYISDFQKHRKDYNILYQQNKKKDV